jgi:hypothetical protein
MFDRLALAFIVKEMVQILPMPQLNYSVEQGFITAETLFFNNVVLTKEELDYNWIIPAKNSWLAKKISFPKTVS